MFSTLLVLAISELPANAALILEHLFPFLFPFSKRLFLIPCAKNAFILWSW